MSEAATEMGGGGVQKNVTNETTKKSGGLEGVVVDASVLIKGMRVDEIVAKHLRSFNSNTNAINGASESASGSGSGNGGESGVKLYTVAEVMKEVRNEFGRQQLQLTPYEVSVREPSAHFINVAVDFAKATGDYHSLSTPDLKVIALSCQLEWELAHRMVDPAPSKPVTLIGRPSPSPSLSPSSAAGVTASILPPQKNPEGFYYPKQVGLSFSILLLQRISHFTSLHFILFHSTD
jgi:rRNA maturation endonuclease Nob1